ncbi:hypothetical protein LWI29_014509 [Acer saccharum]|nr:hypothetical protein LWI29_014509 [Acer saccharum]
MVEKVVRKRKQNKLKMKSTDPEMTKDSEILESDRFANVDVPLTSDHDGNILATQESIMIESNSQIQIKMEAV